jgi:EAL domain-containing protein (putative c-di-GMP-specific phosphodiesterase class I)
MQEALRIICVEHRRAEHGVAAQILTDSHLEFGWKCVSSPRELIRATTEFNPHIVLGTDELTSTSSRALLDALRLSRSQPPVILVSSLHEVGADGAPATEPSTLIKMTEQSDRGFNHSAESGASSNAPDAADLRRAFSAILESSTAAAVMTDAKGSVTHANTCACRLLSGSSQRTLVTLLDEAPDQRSAMPYWFPVSPEAGQNAAYSTIEARIADDAVSTCARHRLAYVDEWSRPPALVHIDELIGRGTASKREYRKALALIAVGPDSGRIPEEAFGHNSEVSQDGCRNIEAQTTALRYGSIIRITSDDFLLVLPDPTPAANAATTVRRLLDAIADRAELAERSAPTPACATEGAPHTSTLTHQSTTVMREPTWPRYCRPPVHQAAFTPIGAKLNDAVQRQALAVMYQPQFDLKTGRGCGIEALARWTLASGDIISPSIFIPIAEQEGMIHALGAWMLRSACATAYDWCGRDAHRTTLSVNVSALQIDEAFCSVIEKTLAVSRFPAKHLELEITESALIGEPDLVIDCLQRWKRLGIRIAMDDFGTGYSSLSYLSRLPVDTLKVDRSLIHRMTLDKKSRAVTRAIVSLGAELGVDVVAEGVETEEQLQMLTTLGCPRVQGYLLARPMPAKQAQVALRKPWGDRLRPINHAATATAVQSYAL